MEATMEWKKNPGLDIVKNRDNMANLNYIENGVAYYVVEHEGRKYAFPVDFNNSEDVGTADFAASIKALTLMRYVRKAIGNGQLVPVCELSHVTGKTFYYKVEVDNGKFLFPVEQNDVDSGTRIKELGGTIFHREMGIDKLSGFVARAAAGELIIKIG